MRPLTTRHLEAADPDTGNRGLRVCPGTPSPGQSTPPPPAQPPPEGTHHQHHPCPARHRSTAEDPAADEGGDRAMSMTFDLTTALGTAAGVRASARRAGRTTRTCGSPSDPTTSRSPRSCAETAPCARPASQVPWSGASRGASGAESCSSTDVSWRASVAPAARARTTPSVAVPPRTRSLRVWPRSPTELTTDGGLDADLVDELFEGCAVPAQRGGAAA